jgi:hypothetical protein
MRTLPLRRLALAVVTVFAVQTTATAQPPEAQPTDSAGVTAQARPGLSTDKFTYATGEVARIAGWGFQPGETVLLRVGHVVGVDEGEAHLPFVTISDADGRISDAWSIPSADSGSRILSLTAEGQSSGAVALALLSSTEIMIVDDSGADDYPGQKDLNFFTFDYGLPGATAIAVSWGWDDNAWSGNNSGDACTLFDTDADGLANFSFCITVKGIPAAFVSARMYSCSDGRSDRCTQPAPVTGFLSTGSASVVNNADPFGTVGSPDFVASHIQGNTCGNRPACYTNDTVATAVIQLADVGGAAGARLLNVCSYPSQVPNSDPSECVITPNNGFLTIIKQATPSDGTQFTFNLGAGQQSQDGASSWTIAGAGQVQFISMVPGTSYDLSEVVPATWLLSGAACVLQTNPTSPTGTFATATATVNDLEIRSGLETICSFTNGLQNGNLIVSKVVVNDSGGTKTSSDFAFQVNGGSAVTFESDGSNTISVAPGTYTVTEPAVSGYTASYSNCTSITVPAGGSATCTITNNDQPATLNVQKVVVNSSGGNKGFTDFSFSVNGGTAIPFEGDGTNTLTVNAGTYTITEPAVAGYTTGYNNCNNVVIPNGGSASCVITNTDQAATLIVQKVVVNDNGGIKVATDFQFQVNGGTLTTFLQAGTPQEGSNTLSVPAGTYSVTEPAVAGYTTTYSNCTSVTLVNGATTTCVITNNDAKAAPGGSTVQAARLHDTFAISGLRPGAPDAASATATFRLYSDGACQTQVGTEESKQVVGGAAATTTGVLVSVSGSYRWRVTYSGDQFNAGFTTSCGSEITQVTLTYNFP